MDIDAETKSWISLWFWLTLAWLSLTYLAFIVLFVGLPTT